MKFDFQGTALKTAGLAAGGVGAAILNKHLPESLDSTLKPLAIIAVGALVPVIMKEKKGSSLITAVGDGMIARGASDLVSRYMPNLAGIAGIGSPMLQPAYFTPAYEQNGAAVGNAEVNELPYAI